MLFNSFIVLLFLIVFIIIHCKYKNKEDKIIEYIGTTIVFYILIIIFILFNYYYNFN